jgi:aryl-alcohol dehydrogenase-like predicted oxidoreductase
MTPPRRSLGQSSLEISTTGFGSWAAGGDGGAFGWGPQADSDSIAAITHAIASGVNWIDTAAAYGGGHSEVVVGRALRAIPASERPYVFTKGGVVIDPKAGVARRSSPASLRREIEASLGRLAIEAIDLYQVHWPDEDGVPIEDTWGEMVRFLEEGKTRAIGVSNYTVEMLDRCEKIRHVDSLQPPFSMVHRGAAAEVVPWCAEHGTGVIAYSPMASGILTDTFSRERAKAMASNDWRRQNPRFAEPNLTANLALRDALRPIAERHSTTVAAVAVAWVVAWPGMTAAIVGARGPAQVDGWLPGSSLRLAPEDLAGIEAAIESTGAGEGPVRPGK